MAAANDPLAIPDYVNPIALSVHVPIDSRPMAHPRLIETYLKTRNPFYHLVKFSHLFLFSLSFMALCLSSPTSPSRS